MKTIFSFVLLVCLASVRLYGEDDQAMLQKLMRDDSDNIGAIALYSGDMREHIFDAAAHAEGIARLSDVQKKSNESFKTLLASYSKDDQAKVWNITRFDGLIDQLVGGGKKDNAVLDAIAARYPQDVRADAVHFGREHYDLLVAIQVINKEFDQSAESVLHAYPASTQTSFRELLKAPEILSLLDDNIRMTVLLGDLYKRNPELLRQRFNELNLEVARRKTKELDEWKEKMKNDPDAEKELQQSAKDYAKENGYNESDYSNTDPQIVERYVYNPYPYWCGTPWWFEHHYWYPYPYWYHWGFYYSSGRTVWVGTPSWFFVRWHFHAHPHFQYYPHITNCYLDFYGYGPRRYWTRNSHEVRRWITRNQTRLPRDFKENTPVRVERIRKFGETNVRRERSNTNKRSERMRNEPNTPRSPDIQVPGTVERRSTTERPSGRTESPRPSPQTPTETNVPRKQPREAEKPQPQSPSGNREPRRPTPEAVKPQSSPGRQAESPRKVSPPPAPVQKPAATPKTQSPK